MHGQQNIKLSYIWHERVRWLRWLEDNVHVCLARRYTMTYRWPGVVDETSLSKLNSYKVRLFNTAMCETDDLNVPCFAIFQAFEAVQLISWFSLTLRSVPGCLLPEVNGPLLQGSVSNVICCWFEDVLGAVWFPSLQTALIFLSTNEIRTALHCDACAMETQQYAPFYLLILGVAVNSIKVFMVAMEMQQLVPLARSSSCEIFCTDLSRTKY
jgi:hypothetical protein